MAGERAAHLLRPRGGHRHRPEPAVVRRPAAPGGVGLRPGPPALGAGTHEPRERRLPLRRRGRRGQGRHRRPDLGGGERPGLGALRRGTGKHGHQPHDRLVVPQHGAARRRRNVRHRVAPVEYPGRRHGRRSRELRLRPLAVRPRRVGPAGARGAPVSRAHPRCGRRAPPTDLGSGALDHGRPKRVGGEPVERPGRRGAAGRARLRASRDARRGVDPGPLPGDAASARGAGASAGMEHRQRRRGAVAALRGHPGPRLGEPPAGGGRALRPEPRLREAHPVGLFLRPFARSRRGPAPRARHARRGRLREGRRRGDPGPHRGLLQDVRRPDRRAARDRGGAPRPRGAVRLPGRPARERTGGGPHHEHAGERRAGRSVRHRRLPGAQRA